MKLPLAVQRQEEQSNAMIEEIRQRQVAAAAGSEGEASNEPAQPAAPAAAPEPKQPEPPKEREDWKAQYCVLKGKYDAEVPRLIQQNRELKEELRSLRNTMQAAKAPVQDPAIPDPRAKFDPDLIDAVDRIAQQRAQEMVGPLAGAMQKSAYDRFVDKVAELVPDYQQIDLDPQFEVFMSEPDAFSGLTRQELLGDAASKMDAQRVVSFYRAFKSKVSGAVAPPVVPQAPQEPARQLPPVVPQQTGSPGAPAAKKVWTAAEVSAFYSAVSKGHYRGREAQASAIEDEIIAANREGRVRS